MTMKSSSLNKQLNVLKSPKTTADQTAVGPFKLSLSSSQVLSLTLFPLPYPTLTSCDLPFLSDPTLPYLSLLYPTVTYLTIPYLNYLFFLPCPPYLDACYLAFPYFSYSTYLTFSYLTLPYLALCCLTFPFFTLPLVTFSYHTLPCISMAYPCLGLLYFTLTILYHTLSYIVLSYINCIHCIVLSYLTLH